MWFPLLGSFFVTFNGRVGRSAAGRSTPPTPFVDEALGRFLHRCLSGSGDSIGTGTMFSSGYDGVFDLVPLGQSIIAVSVL